MQNYLVNHEIPFHQLLANASYKLSLIAHWLIRVVFSSLFLFICLFPPVAMASKMTIKTTSATTSTPSRILSAKDFQALKLRGVNISSRNLLGDKDFQDLAASGAKLVRMSISLTRCPTCSTYGITSSDLAYAKQVVAYGAKLGFHVVLAVEPLPAGNKAEYWNNPELQKSIIQNWETIASTFRNEPVIIGYDLLNEPVPPGYNLASQEATWTQFANQLIVAIRRVDRDHAIIVEVAPWDLPKGFSQLTPLPFPNLIYSLHFYEPHQVTHQGLSNYTQAIPYPSDADSGIGVWNQARLSSLLNPVRDFSRKYQVPIYVGEFSSIRWAPGQSSYNYINDLTQLFDAEGWSWTYHQYRGWTGWDAEDASSSPNDTQRSSDSPVFTLLRNEFLRNQ